jgi:hypothetical protein
MAKLLASLILIRRDGDFNVEPSSMGVFAALVDPGPSDDGDVLDLDSVTAPVGVPFSLPTRLVSRRADDAESPPVHTVLRTQKQLTNDFVLDDAASA